MRDRTQPEDMPALWPVYRLLVYAVVALLVSIAVAASYIVRSGSLPWWVPTEIFSFGTVVGIARALRGRMKITIEGWRMARQDATTPDPEPVPPALHPRSRPS
jgi:hypothetical protein